LRGPDELLDALFILGDFSLFSGDDGFSGESSSLIFDEAF
jgi:hypothetical protein